MTKLFGIDVGGYLTTVLDGSIAHGRNALVVRMDHRLLSALPEALHQEYSRFSSVLADAPVQGTVAKAKWLLSQNRGSSNGATRRIRVAVHKFGPIPTFDLKKTVDVEVHGKTITVPILAFFNPPNSGTKVETTESIPYFLDALAIDPYRVFTRYFEDVASRMLDICEHGNTLRSIAWLREIETIIGESITSKLRIIKPRSEAHEGGKPLNREREIDGFEWRSWKHPQSLNERDYARYVFFSKHVELVYFVNYIRNALLYLVNRAYIPLGIHAEDERYAKRISAEHKKFERFFGADRDVLGKARRDFPEFDELIDYISAYRNEDEDALHMTLVPSNSVWLNGVKTFVRHLYHVGSKPRSAERPAFFISYHYSDRRSETVSALAARHLENTHACDVYREPNYMMGTWFRDSIKASIWKSDRVFSFAVGDPHHSTLGIEKEFNWLFAESEHALQQGKPPVFFLDEGYDTSHYQDKIANTGHPVLTENRRADDAARRSKFGEAWLESQHVHSAFNKVPLDTRISKRLDEEFKRSSKSHRMNILTGFLSMFESDYIELIIKRLLPASQTNNALARRNISKILSEASAPQGGALPGIEEIADRQAAKLTRYALSHGRCIVVNGEKYWAVKVEEVHQTLNNYRITLGNLAQALFPEEDYQQCLQILSRCHEVAVTMKRAAE